MKVNGDILTKTELEAKQIAALRGRINSAVDAEAMKNDETLKKMIAEVTPKILVDTIDEMLLLQLGKEKGYHVTDQQFKDWLADSARTRTSTTTNKFKAALAQEGMTMDDLRRNFEKQVTVYRVQQDEVGQKLQITEEEARQYYLGHQSEFVERADGHAARDLGRDPDQRRRAGRPASTSRRTTRRRRRPKRFARGSRRARTSPRSPPRCPSSAVQGQRRA